MPVTNPGAPTEEAIRDEAEFRRTLLMALGILGGIALVGFFFMVDALTNRLVSRTEPFYHNKESILFGEGDRTKRIDDLNEVATFRTAIISAPEVQAHHSHSVDEIRFFFPDEPSKIYFLGRDSDNADEFLLEAARSYLNTSGPKH